MTTTTAISQQRQQAFQKLRPVCVELSSVALGFKGRQTSVKNILSSLEQQHQVLQTLGSEHQLDAKLAEYAFFPLTHVFNESQRLSPRCMQVAVESVTILVSQGWRSALAPAMGKQLLILMSLLAGGDPRKQTESPTDELKAATFNCIATLIEHLSSSRSGKLVLQDQSNRNIVDQLAYLLVDSLTEAVSDAVQLASADALLELNASINSRVFLASLLPRTVSALTKALRSSTQARRTRVVLVKNLELLQAILISVLADNVALGKAKDSSENDALNEPWLKATAAQIKNALTHVCQLRSHEQVDVRNALLRFCMSVIEECNRTLEGSISVLIETAVMLSGNTDDEAAKFRLRSLISVRPELAETLRESFYNWCQSLPRVMQGNDDKPKEYMLSRITNAFNILNETASNTGSIISILGPSVLNSVTATLEMNAGTTIQTYPSERDQYMSLVRPNTEQNLHFGPVLYNHQSQRESAQNLQKLIMVVRQESAAGNITRRIIDSLAESPANQKAASLWLAIQLLQRPPDSPLAFEDIFDFNVEAGERSSSRVYLIQDLYSQTKDILLESSPYGANTLIDHRITALALETVTLQAQQLGAAYRPELYEMLYPVLALLSSKDDLVQNHAITTLNILASACEYGSVSALLIENVDYLVNSIAWKLNTFNLSPEAPAVLHMVIRLVGAKVIPFLDDLIASIFTALDSFHGYTQWVEMLFEVLTAMVDESVKQPELALTDGQLHDSSQHHKSSYPVSSTNDILDDLRSRKRRKLTSGTSTHGQTVEPAPRRPWTRPQDDPTHKPDPTEGKDLETLLREAETADEENDLPAPNQSTDKEEDPSTPVTKSHDLLLKIARATVPHLSSPSARVRHTLLQLLAQISPLLARHENTFLPLINAIWPGITQRLFDTIASSTSPLDEQIPDGETAYNVAAAADVAANLCDNAGDFMTTRVEQIFTPLKAMYSRMWKEISAQMARNQKRSGESAGLVMSDTSGRNITGVVDLQVVSNNAGSDSTVSSISRGESKYGSAVVASASRTSTGQTFHSLVRLLVAILGHVRVSDDNADEIFGLLAPLMDYPGAVGKTVNDALERYNADTVWVMRCRKMGEDEIIKGARAIGDRVWKEFEVPHLRETLRGDGVDLRSIVF